MKQPWALSLCIIALLFTPLATTATPTGIVNVSREFHHFKKHFQHNPQLLRLALNAYNCGVSRHQPTKPYLLTIVDYQRPSYEKRLWVLDLKQHHLIYHTYVAHGVGSGRVLAHHFSNRVNSFDSSLGLFKTGDHYKGSWGYSMRLYGLEPGINNNAYKRDIVMHGGRYANAQSVAKHGMLGMSHGCLVVPPHLDKPIIDKVKNGSLIFAYYPDHRWLQHSRYLHCGTQTTSVA